MAGSNPSTGADSFMSRAMPCGRPSMMSISTTSARPFCTTRIAVVAPTNPLPTTVTLMSRLLRLERVAGSPGPRGAVASLGAQSPQHPVPPLDDEPPDGAGRRARLEVPVRQRDGLVLDDQPW